MVRRLRTCLGSLSTIFILAVLYSQFLPQTPSKPFYDNTYPPNVHTAQSELKILAENLISLFREHQPVPKTINITNPVGATSVHQGDKLNDVVHLKSDDIVRMQRIHLGIVQSLPTFPSKIFAGQGIVMVGGGRFLRICLLSIRMLRRTGTTLPVELWMADYNEYDAKFCEEVSSLQVRCRVITDYLGETVIKRYQLKSFAMLLSSFAEILFLDADNFPVISVNDIFMRGSYTSSGAVIWPDYWAATASPLLFQIVKRPQIFMQTCETGQLMWNKQTHFTSLVLVCYYNFYGPDYFYPLLTLGAPGEGDKETFLLACQVMGHSYTFIDRAVGTLGYHDVSEFRGTGMAQADPRNSSRYLFIHAHFPKMDGPSLFKDGTLHNSLGQIIRSFWGGTAREMAGYDVEAAAFQELAYIECNSSLAQADSVICDRVLDHVNKVHG